MPANPGSRITIGTTPTLLCPARTRTQRGFIQIDNISAVTIYTGVTNPSVTTLTGRPLAAGDVRTIVNTANDSEATGALYAVVATGTAIVLVTEGN